LLIVPDISVLSQEIYRQKLEQCVADGELDENDVSALLRLRVMLCIPQQTVEAAHSDICGSLFEKVTSFFLVSFIFFCHVIYLVLRS
jgi:hypothetical protein